MIRFPAIPMLLLAALCGAAGEALAQYPPEVRGKIIDAGSGSGIPGAEVSLGDGTKATTGSDGWFALRALRPGRAELMVRRVGYAPHRRAIELANGRTETLVIRLTAIPFELPALETRVERAPDAGVTVIDRERIERTGSADLGEMLRQEPGLVVSRRGGPGSPATVSIRGSDAGQVLVLIDGVPLNDPLTGEADLSLVTLGAIERITVLRGAQSARYGARALGGAIVVERRQARRLEVEATLGAGRWGTRHAAGRLAAGGAPGGVSAALGGEWREFGGGFPVDLPVERGGGTGSRNNADTGALTLDGSVGIDGQRFGGRIHAELFDVSRGMPGTVVQPSMSGRQSQQRVGVAAEGRARLGSGAATLGLTVQRQNATFADPTPPFGVAYDQRTRATTVHATATVVHALAGGDVSAGVEVRRVGVESNTLSAGAGDATRFAGVWTALRPPALASGRWQIEAGGGVRADVLSLTRGAVVSPQMSVGLRRGHLGAELRWARGYNPPSLADLFFQEGVQVQPNPDLEPERVRSEWSVTAAARDLPVGPFRAELLIAAYTADVRGMIIWSPDFRYVWSPDNFDVDRRGAEVTARIAAPAGRIALSGSAARTDVRYTGPVLSGQVIYRPRWNATLAAEGRLIGIDAGLGYRYVGARPTGIGSSLNQLDALHLLDLRIAREVPLGGVQVRARVLVENLLDAREGMLVDYPFPGRLLRADLTILRGDRGPSLSTHPSGES